MARGRVAPAVLYSIRGPDDGDLARRKDERGSLRDHLGEPGRPLPAPGEGADAVNAADVGQGREAVRDGRPARESARVSLTSLLVGVWCGLCVWVVVFFASV